MKENVLIIAGEVSGELHGSSIVKEMLKLNPDIHFFGIGGEKMKDAGVELVYHIKDMAFLGLIEIIKHIPFLRKVKKHLREEIVKRGVKSVILIDYPGFNLNFAKSIKEFDLSVYYYIAPQIWAWGKNRIKIIEKVITKMIVVFPFEEKLYSDFGIDVSFVGHPLLDLIDNYKYQSQKEFFTENNIDTSKKLICIFPGSRKQEIESLLKICSETVSVLNKNNEYQFAVAAINNFSEKFYRSFLTNKEIKLIYNKNYDLLKYSDFGIIKSGTSTLEAALMGLPFMVIYKASKLSYFIGKHLISIDYFSLANILANKKIVQEYIQNDANESNIFNELCKMISDQEYVKNMKREFSDLRNKLGENGAAQKVAKIIFKKESKN